MNRENTFHFRALLAALVALILTPVVHGQSQTPGPGADSSTNPVRRIFYDNFTSPSIRSIVGRSDSSLDSMIRDGKLPLTAEDVVRLALENNVDINVERYNPYFSAWSIDKGRGVLDPAIRFNSNLNRLVTPSSSFLQGGDTLLNLNTIYDISVRKPFEVGLDLDLNFNSRRIRSSSFFTSLNPSLTSNLTLTLTQHLLKDFGTVSRGRFIRIARNSQEISQQDFAARTIEIVTGALNAYWDLVFVEEDIKVREASLKLAEVVLEQNRIQAEVGTMAPLDVVQAEAEVAARREQVITARFNRKITENQLKKMISSRMDPGVIAAQVDPLTRPEPPAPPASGVMEAIQRAMEIRPEVKRSQKDLDNKQIQVDYTRNQLRPAFDLVASYSQNGLGGDRILRDTSGGFFGAPIVGIEPGGFFDSLDSLFSRKFLGYTVGFNLTIPIGNNEARANSAQAQIDYRQGEERLRSLRQRIAIEVREAYDRVEMDKARIDAAEVTVRYGQERLRGEQDKYSLGATTTRFILEAQRDLQDAQNRLIKSKVDLIKSRIALDKAVGDTLGAHNIEIQEALGPVGRP